MKARPYLPDESVTGGWREMAASHWGGAGWVRSDVETPTLSPNLHREDPVPYSMPTTAPYNPPVPCQIPTYDGSGQTTHPGVVDFGPILPGGQFNGYRFWMVHTPYKGSDGQLENPSISVSNNGWDWHDPYGIANPVAALPIPPRFNADGDLAWNPDLERLELIWKYSDWTYRHSHSTDGITWTPYTTIATVPGDWVSPGLVRMASGVWRLYFRTPGDGGATTWAGIAYREAATPEGPYAPAVTCTLAGAMPNAAAEQLWHWDVTDPEPDGSMWALGSTHTTPTGIYCGKSTDGVAFTFSVAVITESAGWDAYLYRPTLARHENGAHMRVWYGALSGGRWAIGHTLLPLSLWPA